MSDDPFAAPRAANGRAPDVFRPGGWIPMREYPEDEAVDFVVVGTGAGGGTLTCELAEMRLFRRRRWTQDLTSGRWKTSRPTSASRQSSTGPTTGSSTATIRCTMGSKNSGKAVGGSTVHFAMVSLRFRPEWFKSRSCSATARTGRSIGAKCGTITPRSKRR